MPKKPITLFSFGYWGWGTSTPQLVKAVDAVEKSRGFKPPIFVDTRISRSVRAPGFNGGAFGKLLGDARYHWMKSLGNERIKSKKGKKIQISDPSAAVDLLDLAIDASEENRRIILYCSCIWPKWEGEVNCHRAEIGSLLLKSAKKRGIQVEVTEWPGSKPGHLEMTVSPNLFRSVRNGRMTIPVKKSASLAEIASLGWGSIVTLHSDGETIHRPVGPAAWQKKEWALPVLPYFLDPTTSLSDYQKDARKMRREMGLEPRQS